MSWQMGRTTMIGSMTVVAAPETAAEEQTVPAFPAHPPEEKGDWRSRIPAITAWLAAVAGVMTLISAATRPFSDRMRAVETLVPLDARLGARFVAALIGLLLLMLARQLFRRKHRAWLAATVASAVLVGAHTLKGFDLEEAAAHLALLVLLIVGRRQFDAKSDPPSIAQFVRFVPVFAAGVIALGVLELILNRRTLDEGASISSVVVTVLRAMVGLPGPLEVGNPVYQRFFLISMSTLTLIGVIAAAYLFFRPVLEGYSSHAQERERVRGLVRKWGSDSLAYFTLRDDKNYFFSRTGEAVIAYRYLNGIACISGDPVGEPDAVPELLRDFRRVAHERGWKVAVLAGREDHRSLYEPLGMKCQYLGDEAIVNLDRFTLEGRKIRKVRQSCHRLSKAGYSVEALMGNEVTSDLRGDMERITRKWRGKAPERGFSMSLGRPLVIGDEDCMVLVARDADGRARGYLRMVPFYGGCPGYSLDEMRREPDTPNGLTEFLVVRACEELRDLGYRRFSLNFAAFARIMSGEMKLTLWEKVQRWIIRRANPYFQIESLLNFNAKFFPDWVARCIYYEEGVNLVRVALAYLEIEAFLRLGPVRRGLIPHLDLADR